METYRGVGALDVVDCAGLVGARCGGYASALAIASMVSARASRDEGIAEAGSCGGCVAEMVVLSVVSGKSGAKGYGNVSRGACYFETPFGSLED